MAKWNGKYSNFFNVTRGTRQGSVLSPYLLNVFINQLLVTLQNVDTGIVIGDSIYNSFAYADDVSLFCTSIPGLQHLINICVQYSVRWRFNLNQEKSKCMIVGKSPFIYEPHWYMDSNELCIVDKLEILGNIFNSKGSGVDHVNKRIARCRQSFYGLSPAGMLYPGASTDVQSYLFKSICQPTLTYGADCVNITDNDILKLDSAQCKLIKQSLGLSKRSHNTELLRALKIKRGNDIVDRNITSLFHRIHVCTRTLCVFNLSQYVLYGVLTPGSLLDRVVRSGHSPINLW